MYTFPADFAAIILTFQPLLRDRTWKYAQALLFGAILAPGKRTVTSVLRILGLSEERHFQNFHRVLNRSRWDLRKGSQLLLRLLLNRFAPQGPLVFGMDDTVERRWGRKIRARGIYRDAVRSSEGQLVKTSGLRWLSLMLLVRIPWAQRVWALPVLTSLAPSTRYYEGEKRRPKTLLEWAEQQCRQIRRWLPDRPLTLVVDGAFASLAFLDRVRQTHITCVTRLRLDARLYQPAPARSRRPGAGRPRRVGARVPSLATRLTDPGTRWHTLHVACWYGTTGRSVQYCTGTALWYHGGRPLCPLRWVLLRDTQGEWEARAFLSTDPTATPADIVAAYVSRWQVEVTFEECRAHLGLETQRQWSDKAIARSTPLLLALFSLVTLLAAHLPQPLAPQQTAWYRKSNATFSDTLAAVRRHLWLHFFTSPFCADHPKFPSRLLEHFAHALCYAA